MAASDVMKNTECFGGKREKEKTIHLEEVIIMKNAKKLIPGAAIALVIAAAAKFLESLESAGLRFYRGIGHRHVYRYDCECAFTSRTA